ncbi:hypothetical protein MTR67_034410 [Solanum verrucosum]|uniref:Uncharacterized protein n=1 Tax=Solanum verrucosum TaxID=315347 RepID=A0AAF0U857_SOLVR|nr:hypothetical protein MTR67_034410 [Solanum verrucosum]
MPNYGRERLNSRFSITVDRTQYFELKNFNDTTHFMNAQLRGFMQNYEHELLNSSCNTPETGIGRQGMTPLGPPKGSLRRIPKQPKCCPKEQPPTKGIHDPWMDPCPIRRGLGSRPEFTYNFQPQTLTHE